MKFLRENIENGLLSVLDINEVDIFVVILIVCFYFFIFYIVIKNTEQAHINQKRAFYSYSNIERKKKTCFLQENQKALIHSER